MNLPIAWGRSEGLDRGDLVQILMTDEGYLLIVPAYRVKILKEVPEEGLQAPTSTPSPGSRHQP